MARIGRAGNQQAKGLSVNVDLLSGDLVTLGAHSVTHAALAGLSRFECRREIDESRERCRQLMERRVEGFAYPYGDMSLAVREDVAAGGFGWACSTEEGFMDQGQTNFYALPRIAVPNAPMSALRQTDYKLKLLQTTRAVSVLPQTSVDQFIGGREVV
jgi:peptidoglycan/xylan/chitin deacetylase (PgdA/CDA1 family)